MLWLCAAPEMIRLVVCGRLLIIFWFELYYVLAPELWKNCESTFKS